MSKIRDVIMGRIGIVNTESAGTPFKREVTLPIVGKNEPNHSYYQKVYRVPDSKSKRTYSKIVNQEKAQRLIVGKQLVSRDGTVVDVPLKRVFIRA